MSVTIQFQKAGLLGAVPAVGENDQYFALHFGGQYGEVARVWPPFSFLRSWAAWRAGLEARPAAVDGLEQLGAQFVHFFRIE